MNGPGPHSARDVLVKRAQQAIAQAIRRGDLKPAKNRRCVDCGRHAYAYDHRDYREPLKVEPVCNFCHHARGPGLPPLTPEDGHYRKHELKIRSGRVSGVAWGALQGGEGYSPLERRLVVSPDIETALAVSAAEDIGGCGILRASPAHGQGEDCWKSRADFFRAHDPWADQEIT